MSYWHKKKYLEKKKKTNFSSKLLLNDSMVKVVWLGLGIGPYRWFEIGVSGSFFFALLEAGVTSGFVICNVLIWFRYFCKFMSSTEDNNMVSCSHFQIEQDFIPDCRSKDWWQEHCCQRLDHCPHCILSDITALR